MSYKDQCIVQKAFDEATANPNQSEFPDYIFDDGFIEHFQVTSSHENRKGSTMKLQIIYQRGILQFIQLKHRHVGISNIHMKTLLSRFREILNIILKVS